MAKSPIGKFNRRPTFQNLGYSVDAGGGTSTVVLEEWNAWAEIIDTSSSAFVLQSQGLTAANYKVTVRFDSRFKSITRMIYEGQFCKCESLDVQTEGYKNFLILRFSKIDKFIDIPAGNFVNWQSLTFDDITGIITFINGDSEIYFTQISFYSSPYTGFNYVNAEGLALSVGPTTGNTSYEPYFTPGQVIIKWRLTLRVPPFDPITPWNEQTITVTRLAKRWYRLAQVVNGTEFNIFSFVPLKFYNVNGILNVTVCNDISSLIVAWNADVANINFQIENNRHNSYYEVLFAPGISEPVYPMQYLKVEPV